jgi:hypothetical protein
MEEKGIYAHSAIVAMGEIFSTADSAKSAFCAVVRILFDGHPKIANCAMMRPKLNATVDAIVSTPHDEYI